MHRSSHTSEDDISGANQVLSELSSAVTEVLSEKNMNLPGNETHHFFHKMIMSYVLATCFEGFSLQTGPDSVTAVKSITKSIKILSPGNIPTFRLYCFLPLIFMQRE